MKKLLSQRASGIGCDTGSGFLKNSQFEKEGISPQTLRPIFKYEQLTMNIFLLLRLGITSVLPEGREFKN